MPCQRAAQSCNGDGGHWLKPSVIHKHLPRARRAGLILEAASRPLLTLFQCVVAWLAQRLQVRLIEEQYLVTLVRFDMVADEFRWVTEDLPASCHLAREQITRECLDAQPLPSDQLVPLAPWLRCLTMLVAVLLITRRWTQARWQRAERRLECGKSGHISRKQKGDR